MQMVFSLLNISKENIAKIGIMNGVEELIQQGVVCCDCSAYIGPSIGHPRQCFSCESKPRHEKLKQEKLKRKKKKKK